MDVFHVITFFLVTLGLTLLAEPIARRIRLPVAALLVLFGFVVSEGVVYLGYDTGIRSGNFHALIFDVFLPILVFQAAYEINTHLLKKNLGLILFISFFIMGMTALLSGVGIYYGINHPTGFPWEAAFLTGALLAATDPIAVSSALQKISSAKRLSVILEGESLFNDAAAIVLFSVLLSLASMPSESLTWSYGATFFAKTFLGGLLVGLVVALLTVLLIRVIADLQARSVLLVLAAYGSFLISEHVFHVSGVMATLVTGLVISRTLQQEIYETHRRAISYLWGLLGYLAHSIVFILMGVTITLAMFAERWLAMLIAIVAVLLARLISIFVGLPLVSFFMKSPLPTAQKTFMVWGGLRGAVTLALALSLPTDLEYWWTIQSIAYGVVVFSLFVQAPSLGRLGSRM